MPSIGLGIQWLVRTDSVTIVMRLIVLMGEADINNHTDKCKIVIGIAMKETNLALREHVMGPLMRPGKSDKALKI